MDQAQTVEGMQQSLGEESAPTREYMATQFMNRKFLGTITNDVDREWFDEESRNYIFSQLQQSQDVELGGVLTQHIQQGDADNETDDDMLQILDDLVAAMPSEYKDDRKQSSIPQLEQNGQFQSIFRTISASELAKEYRELNVKGPMWKSFQKDFKSAKKYSEVIEDVAVVLDSMDKDLKKNEYEWLCDWLEVVRFKQNPSASGKDVVRYKASTLFGFLSVLNAFHKYTGKGKLEEHCPILQKKVVNWGKDETIKKSATLSRQQICAYLKMPDDENSIVRKAYAVTSLAFAARGGEAVMAMHDDIERVTVTDKDGTITPEIKILYDRSKRSSAQSADRDYVYIRDPLQVQAVENYLALFPEPRDGRLWRKVTIGSKGKFVVGSQVLGKNMLAKIGYHVGIAVGLSHEKAMKLTGHCWRRSAITLACESGLSVAAIKTMSDHKSDTVLQGYIAKSDNMKRKCADALRVDDVIPVASNFRLQDDAAFPNKKRSPPKTEIHYHYHFENATINAPIQFTNTSNDPFHQRMHDPCHTSIESDEIDSED